MNATSPLFGRIARRYETIPHGRYRPRTGIYRVTHTHHRLSPEAVLIKGERFPRCAKCTADVLFELAYAAPDLFSGRSQSRIYELPVIEDDATAARA